MMAAGSTAGFLFVEVARITMDCKDHVAFAICENSRFLCGEIVHNLLASLRGIDGRFRLFCRNCTEGGEYRSIDTASVP
jgi:hypothetical protein